METSSLLLQKGKQWPRLLKWLLWDHPEGDNEGYDKGYEEKPGASQIMEAKPPCVTEREIAAYKSKQLVRHHPKAVSASSDNGILAPGFKGMEMEV